MRLDDAALHLLTNAELELIELYRTTCPANQELIVRFAHAAADDARKKNCAVIPFRRP